MFRLYVCHQDTSRIVSIYQSKSRLDGYDTLALQVSIENQTTVADLDLEKHSWTNCFNSFQHQARPQLENIGYLSAFYYFSLIPIRSKPVRDRGVELSTDLYLCTRIGHAYETSRAIFSPAVIDLSRIRDNVSELGFPL